MAREYKLKNVKPAPDHGLEREDIHFDKELNGEQLAAVKCPPGPALIIAGAGSGKTRTLIYRVAYLLQNRIPAQNILLLTFTNKAAREMLERVDHLLPGQAGGIWGGTFHSICNRILRRHADKVGLSKNFSILDADDQKSLMTKIIREVSGTKTRSTRKKKAEDSIEKGDKFPKAPVILSALSLAVNTRSDLQEHLDRQFGAENPNAEKIREVIETYEKRKSEANAVDFDDLLVLTLLLFQRSEEVLADYQYQFQFILVDEYQDTNPLQGELVDLLAKRHGNLMVVGDDAQSIYSWRGADFRYILDFPERYPKSQIFRIETNYRSTPEVLTLANASIEHNVEQFEKQLRAVRRSGAKPVLVSLHSAREQAAFVSQRIEELVDDGLNYSDIAVLYRAHFLSMELQLQLTTSRIPFLVTSGLKFFEQAHIKDFSAFLRLAVNPLDEPAFDRVVQLVDGIGDVSAKKLWDSWRRTPFAQAKKFSGKVVPFLLNLDVPPRARQDWEQLAYLFGELVDEDGKLKEPQAMMFSIWEGIYADYLRASYENAEQREQDIDTFRTYAADFKTVEDLLVNLSLVTGPESAESTHEAKKKPSVTLSSIHQAKGLEWKVVFLIGLNDGSFPSARSLVEGGDDSLEEERRLFYVAVTRAMDLLHLSYTRVSARPYDYSDQKPSLFLSELPKNVMERWKIGY